MRGREERLVAAREWVASRCRYDDDDVERLLRDMADDCGRMPTPTEVQAQDRRLHGAIKRRGGYPAWAERLGLPRKRGGPPRADVIGEVYHARRVLADFDAEGERWVRVICVLCGAVAEVRLRSARRRACPCHRSRGNAQRASHSTARNIGDTAREEDTAVMLGEAGQRCPELWRAAHPDDRDVVNEALGKLLGVLRPHLDGGAFSLDAIGALLGVSKERVRQIEAVALKKVRLKGGAALREYAEHLDERGGEWTYPEGMS